MVLNLIKLRESLKQDLLGVIYEHEKKYKTPVFVTKAALCDVISDVKTAELQEILSEKESEEKASNGKN